METQQPFQPYGASVPPPAQTQVVATATTYMADATADADTLKYSTPGWSWGAFLFNVMFAAGLRKYWFLLFLLLYWIPFIGGLCSLGVMIYFGVKGREMAAESKVFANKDQYVGFMKGVDHAGKVYLWFFIILIPIAVIGILSSVVLASLSSARDNARNTQSAAESRALDVQYQENDNYDMEYGR